MNAPADIAPPQPVLLKDYAPPPFLVDEVDLDIRLMPTRARVRARLDCRPNPALEGTNQPLALNGEKLYLAHFSVGGRILRPEEFALDDKTLTIFAPPREPFTLEIETQCNPDTNTELTGLYRTNETYCTQCEAEGFRRITYFPDRPDVLARYTTRIEARKLDAPIMLSNGNLIEAGEVDGTERHFAVWRDPHPKPSYLFALVAGNLAEISDSFTTASGREVALKIYVEHGKQDRADYAMGALKRAMRWDEEKFGREYDLDIFMIVAVSDFNMGAMENKGLNIFNDKYILARPDTATDTDYAHIEAVIAHEYFHNWTGNRITCRDWFQLCLKEGLTVFRDQEFSADQRSRVVQRIDDVRQLLNQQFPEDAGPLAHPVRPESYYEINNFYTATVYEKGAEVIRMLKTLIGDDAFARGMEIYFSRHDGTAATVEDFITAMAEASARDLGQFMNWYTQAGTPVVTVKSRYDAKAKTLNLAISQFCPPTPDQTVKAPYHIPLRVSLIGRDGKAVLIKTKQKTGTVTGTNDGGDIIELTGAEQQVTFNDVPRRAVPSLLRGFSAPVRLSSPLKERELLFLMVHDDDPFNRWQAGQTYALGLMKRMARDIARDRPLRRGARLAEALQSVLDESAIEPALKARCLDLPSEADLARDIAKNVDPEAIHIARSHLRKALSEQLETSLTEIYQSADTKPDYSPDADSAGRRALKNACLALLAETGKVIHAEAVARQFEHADNMTDMIAALEILAHSHGPARAHAFDQFYQRWRDDPLVLDKWFMLQARSSRKDTLDQVIALKNHDAFTMTNPNRVRALIGSFAMANPARFHDRTGKAYGFIADCIIALDGTNPQVAARLAGAFKSWRSLEPKRRGLMKAALARIAATEGLSQDTSEIVSKSIV